ncbi:D-inositol 3-phosphate glycosyltransferase [Posidoniimonas polymericola]|uniref:D-inositol 3-phosphate glycosyltransferase n=2 Tax=Posidoniimonas polymericola TaxID=2528002 RepID=A0A5C5YTS8_9BACT|nr:D-inositol 3-phosphate glycosyltransferase [Posidoniimonas polymericola]
MIPNGVDLPPEEESSVQASDRRYALFLSRIHVKKGVRELLEAWVAVAPDDWELVIAGQDEQGIMRRLNLPPRVRYVGPIDGSEKWSLYRNASLFVLPTYSENFGVVVAEALMAGLPVITTHGAPWECLESERCGWWIPMEPGPLRETLRDALATHPDELQAMGRRGQTVVAQRFSWPEIARQMVDVYKWMVRGGSPPECVVKD